MPTALTNDIDMTFTRRADPDPEIGVGEAYNANRQYQYTWVMIGPVRIKMHGRERARRTLQKLCDTLSKQLALMDHSVPEEGEPIFDDDGLINRNTAPTRRRPPNGGS
jgi:hypothetical protein